MPAGGHAFEPSELLSDDVWIGGFEADHSSTKAFASDGDLLVAQDAGAMDRFGVPRRFATGRRAPTRLEIVAGATSATVAWSDGQTTWTADQRMGGRIAPARSVKGGLRALAARGDGRLLLVTDDAGAGSLRARVREAGAAAFAAGEPISGTSNTYDVLAEFAPGSGRAVVSVQRNERLPGQDRARQAVLTATRRAR